MSGYVLESRIKDLLKVCFPFLIKYAVSGPFYRGSIEDKEQILLSPPVKADLPHRGKFCTLAGHIQVALWLNPGPPPRWLMTLCREPALGQLGWTFQGTIDFLCCRFLCFIWLQTPSSLNFTLHNNQAERFAHLSLPLSAITFILQCVIQVNQSP